MLDRDAESFFHWDVGFLVTKCCTSCFTGMSDEVFYTDAGSISDRNAGCFNEKWITFSTGMLNELFDNDAGLDV